MARDVCWLDGIDADDLGLMVLGPSVPGALDGPPVGYDAVDVPGRWGPVRTGRRGVDQTASLVVTASVRAETPAALAEAMDRVKRAVGGRVITVRTAYQPDRQWSGVLGAITAEPFSSWLDGRAVLALPVLLDSPLASALGGSVVGFGAAPVPVPLGTAESTPVIRVVGAATNPVVIYRDARGAERARFGLTGVLGADDYLAVDMGRHMLALSTAGVATDAMAWRTTGRYFALDPLHGDPDAGAWPTLEVTAGTGLVLYTKAYQ